MNSKKSFTLFEIIISIILISIIYTIAINNFSSKEYKSIDKITLENLKEELLKYGKENSIENSITIKCIADDLSCFIFLDNNKIPEKEKLEPFLKQQPEVYKYNKNQEKIEFMDLELEQLQRYEIIFQYSCKKNSKCDEFIVQTDELTYIFNTINKKPDTIKYLNDIDEYFDSRIEEVKDAF